MAKTVKNKSWADKMEHPSQPEVKILDKGFADLPSGSKMLIPTPRLIGSYLQHSKAGHLIETKKMRTDLAAELGAKYTCPLTTGIFLRILAEYTYEQKQKGIPLKDLAPIWRVIRPEMPIWKKLSFDPWWLEETWQAEVTKPKAITKVKYAERVNPT
jgi:hypothetical protein